MLFYCITVLETLDYGYKWFILIIDYEEKISNYFALLNKSKYNLQKIINLFY
ncbi:hypothetical protein JSCD14_21920 [Clostridioides difficile]|nr:hypothetical protein BN163_360017 [Clostridioides difficile T5]CCK92872.1 hypothetical protein BN164_330005 [Clostridioides difficile T20]CCK96500.1 hypothetical protein BN165_350017 [Clostridioides difficile E1]CCL00527.1 hypothetical protein BN166_420005 [Clostridioides difficile E10]GMK61645.1 hypothetical protein JSCD1_15290 [Clostridioides difficile]